MAVPETIQQLRSARATHKAWVVRAEAMVNGLPVDGDHEAISASKCAFGHWLKRETKRLQDFSVFSQIEASHDVFHHTCLGIAEALTTTPKGFGKLFGQGAKEKKENADKARMLLSKLYISYDEMRALMDTLEKDYLEEKSKNPKRQPMEVMQTQSFRDVSKMMDDLEKDVDSWLK